MQMYILFLTTQLFSVDFLSQNVILLCKSLLCTPHDRINPAYR